MKVRLKDREDLIKAGFQVNDIGRKDFPVHIELIKPSEKVAISLDLARCHSLEVVTQNSITEEWYKMFKDAFEVIEK